MAPIALAAIDNVVKPDGEAGQEEERRITRVAREGAQMSKLPDWPLLMAICWERRRRRPAKIVLVAGTAQPRPRRARVQRRLHAAGQVPAPESRRRRGRGEGRLAGGRRCLRGRQLHRVVHGWRRKPPAAGGRPSGDARQADEERRRPGVPALCGGSAGRPWRHGVAGLDRRILPAALFAKSGERRGTDADRAGAPHFARLGQLSRHRRMVLPHHVPQGRQARWCRS